MPIFSGILQPSGGARLCTCDYRILVQWMSSSEEWIEQGWRQAVLETVSCRDFSNNTFWWGDAGAIGECAHVSWVDEHIWGCAKVCGFPGTILQRFLISKSADGLVGCGIVWCRCPIGLDFVLLADMEGFLAWRAKQLSTVNQIWVQRNQKVSLACS